MALCDRELVCDRCKSVMKDAGADMNVTNGFFNVTEGFWAQFARDNGAGGKERFVCENCMWRCEKYKEMFGGPH